MLIGDYAFGRHPQDVLLPEKMAQSLLVGACADGVLVQPSLAVPQDLEGYAGYEDYFMSRRAWFLGLLAIFFLIAFWDTWLKGAEYFASLGMEYLITQAIMIAGCLVGIATTNRRFHAGFALIILVYQVLSAFRNYDTMG